MSQENISIERFVAELGKLDEGERARLKRNAGNTLSESRDVLGLFYNKLLSCIQIPEWQEETYFLVATLYPFEKRDRRQREGVAGSTDTPQSRPRNLGASLHQIRSEKNGTGLDRRVERLLDADVHQLPFYLRREVQFVANEGGRIDWEILVQDILRWTHPDHYIQRNWARDYFTTQLESNVM